MSKTSPIEVHQQLNEFAASLQLSIIRWSLGATPSHALFNNFQNNQSINYYSKQQQKNDQSKIGCVKCGGLRIEHCFANNDFSQTMSR